MKDEGWGTEIAARKRRRYRLRDKRTMTRTIRHPRGMLILRPSSLILRASVSPWSAMESMR